MKEQNNESVLIATDRTNGLNIKRITEQYGMLLVFAALFILCSIISPAFLKANNLFNVSRQVSIIGIVSIGMTFVILTGGIDLSVGPTMAFSALLVAGLKDYGAVTAFFAAIVFGFLLGILNGTIITRFKVQPFIVTLGGMSTIVGLGLTYSGGHPIIGTPKALSFFGQGKLFGIVPAQAMLYAVLAIIAILVLKYTRLGRYTYAIGGNEEASKLSGIAVARVKTLIYGISGALAGFAGVIMATHLNVGEANLGTGLEMDVIAAVVIGGTSLQGGTGTIFGSVIGVFIIGVLSNLLNLVNVPGYTQMIIKGVIIVSAVILQGSHNKK